MKKYSIKFWIIFWASSALFLAAWYLFWNIKNKGISAADDIVRVLPINEKKKNEYSAMISIGDFMLGRGNNEKTFLVLFQNNLELRPSGGFLGAFAVVKTKKSSIVSMETYDLSNFDARIPSNIDPPYPMKEIGYVDFWKMRDSNWSPDFETSAKKAEEFYFLGGGEEKFDGVIGITANTLTSMLKVTGPISIEGYPGTYDSENAIIALEYQVEKAFEQQGIEREERKSVINDLASEIEKKINTLSAAKRIRLLKILLGDLRRKDIQLYFRDSSLQEFVKRANWAGEVDDKWSKDYLMVVDANLGAFKSDYYIERAIDYKVDLTGTEPVADLKITYRHTASQKDWMTRNYLTYLRVWLPNGSRLEYSDNFDDVQVGYDPPAGGGKTNLGAIVRVPIGQTKTVEIRYVLPERIKNDYDLKIQKQAGTKDTPVAINVRKISGDEEYYETILKKDIVLSELE